jgi:hypothetical protein
MHPVDSSSARLLERFVPSGLRVLGVVGLAAVGVWLGLMLIGGDLGSSLDMMAVLVAVALLCWVALVRPAVHAYEDHLLLRNLLTDIEVPWHLVESVRVSQTLRVEAGDRVWHGVAISRSVRTELRAQRSARRQPGGATAASSTSQVYAPDYTDFVVDRIRHLAGEHEEVSRRRPHVTRRWAVIELGLMAVLSVASLALLLL